GRASTPAAATSDRPHRVERRLARPGFLPLGWKRKFLVPIDEAVQVVLVNEVLRSDLSRSELPGTDPPAHRFGVTPHSLGRLGNCQHRSCILLHAIPAIPCHSSISSSTSSCMGMP